jgi:hypothetical protein
LAPARFFYRVATKKLLYVHPTAQLPAGVIDTAKKEASAALKSLAATARLKADSVVKSGTARTVILAAAEERGADFSAFFLWRSEKSRCAKSVRKSYATDCVFQL